MINVEINGVLKRCKKGTRVIDLIDNKEKEYVSCKVGHRVRELTYKLNKSTAVELLTLDNEESVRIYESSLRFIFAMACKKLYPELNIRFSYHISRSIFVKILNGGQIFTEEMLQNIKKEMLSIVSEAIPFERETISIEEARDLYEEYHLQDKLELLEYRPENTVHVYRCGWYLNYFYSYMVPSTDYLDKFNLILYEPGIILQYPRAEEKGKLPKFKEEVKYGKTLKEANIWGKTIDAETVARINNNVRGKGLIDFIHSCEARHNKMICELGDRIAKNNKVKLIAIAGPTSSGKTTFSNRLRIELLTKGIKPVKLSMDDYYIDRDLIKPDENGKVDLEDINTIDIKLFNEHIYRLIQGEEVELPRFDFTIGKRVRGKKVKIDKESPIIIEGIHALNEKLTSSIPGEMKFKVYISPHIQINLDNQNPISMTQLRLVRRLVRDKMFRNSSALRTLSMWESVRQGEFKWIYNTEEEADYVFNSELSYELCVLKKYALPLLKKIDKENEYYIEANRLIKFLKYFIEIDESMVPCDSLLREFIGGSCFKE
ncbi:TPA: nucleoside kinase [bacterium]|nr:nucleoside kinase [bacterium]